ncbi:hypothetical protein CANINC_002047 [Pichia inconspicua]|uniref:MICOS complex subunit MIC12 n=1 Tax=Pichia inconspicua TaxID=52247 RepID=A0A4T0X265_9ASCO|nr:hypothetical protein CANINC_002047 [[Candida] inconspicua]
MAGITQGLIAGALVTTSLTYLTGQQFQKNAKVVKKELRDAADIFDKRNDPPQLVSNVHIYEDRNIKEGVKDIWNSEVIRAVNWWYSLQLGNKAAAAIANLFN